MQLHAGLTFVLLMVAAGAYALRRDLSVAEVVCLAG
jgi:hypothetical protein